jgi:septal ring factor EnvC (AmiA/AmiB activator)
MDQIKYKNSNLVQNCEQQKTLVNEIKRMQIAEENSISKEFIETKKKLDKYKNQIREMNRNLSELVNIEEKHDLIKDQLNDI